MRPSFFYYCIYALGFHPTKEPISAKAKVAHNQRQEKKNGGVFFAFALGRSAAEEKSHGF